MKNKLLKVIAGILSAAVLSLSFAGCSSDNDDIIILYTNDVMCAVEDEIGYAGVAAYKKAMLAETPNVALVDLGNAIQGDYIGTVSKGTYIVDIMNKVGYDYAVLGNHEFDYGLEQLKSLIDRSKAKYLGCNIVYDGLGENALSETKPYEIVTYGDKKVAYIGVTTPKTLTQTNPSIFMEEDKYVYDFKSGSSGSKLYTVVQGFVNECKNKGADYVVILSHLGDTEECSPYTSTGLIKATFDVDAVLDSHAGSVIPSRLLKNKQGKDVVLSSTGGGLSNLGKLVITEDGSISAGLISGYTTKDEEFTTYYEELKLSFEEEKNSMVALSDTALKRTDKDGIRTIKNRENTLGNFCADAYRTVTDSDIAFVTADMIQADLPVGEVKYADILNLHPLGNTICKVKVTGQEIIDCLEIASMKVKKEYNLDGKPIGENDFFIHVSGLKYTIDTSVKSTVEFDDLGIFKDMGKNRRVKRVQVLNENGIYVPINPEGEYTVATNNLLAKEGLGGINLLSDNALLIDGGLSDYQVLISYLNDYLVGELGSRYSVTEGRIIIQ